MIVAHLEVSVTLVLVLNVQNLSHYKLSYIIDKQQIDIVKNSQG